MVRKKPKAKLQIAMLKSDKKELRLESGSSICAPAWLSVLLWMVRNQRRLFQSLEWARHQLRAGQGFPAVGTGKQGSLHGHSRGGGCTKCSCHPPIHC